jgi:hypothetical protein
MAWLVALMGEVSGGPGHRRSGEVTTHPRRHSRHVRRPSHGPPAPAPDVGGAGPPGCPVPDENEAAPTEPGGGALCPRGAGLCGGVLRGAVRTMYAPVWTGFRLERATGGRVFGHAVAGSRPAIAARQVTATDWRTCRYPAPPQTNVANQTWRRPRPTIPASPSGCTGGRGGPACC